MKLACQEGMAPSGALQEKLDYLAEYGYEGIEFWGAQFIDTDFSGMRKERVAEVRRLTENHPVKPSTICAGYRGALLDANRHEREIAIHDIETLLYAAGEIGAVGVIVVPIFGSPRIPDLNPYATALELETELLCRLLEPLSKVAEKAGSYILLEPLNRYETHYMNRLEQAVNICHRVGNPNLKLMADFFHMNIEERDIPAAIRGAKEYLAHVHLADSNRLLPGYGHTDFRSGFAALREIGYTGYMALECEHPRRPARGAAQVCPVPARTNGMKPLILAHDLGTSGNKAVLLDGEGQVIDVAFAPYRTTSPEPLAAEQNPADWWRAVVRCTRTLLTRDLRRRDQLVAIGFSGHMNGVVLVDAQGEPVRPALLHADIRAQSQCEQLRQRLGEERYYRLTGNRIAPFTSLPKLMLLQQRDPQTVERARWMLQSKDYCVGRMTGRWGVTDPSDASLTGIYDASCLQWSEEVVEASGIPAHLLPEVVPSTSVVGRVSREAARATGLPEGLPVVLGAGDGASATVGAGVVEVGDCYTCLGSTAWTACLRAAYQPDPAMRLTTLLPAQPHRWVQYGTVQSAGSAWSWFRNLFGKGVSWERLAAEAQRVPAGSEGLLFLPYLSGERAPIWNPQAKGVFFGLQAHHTRAHMARAVLEGVALALGIILQLLREQGAVGQSVRVVGGGTRNLLWMQILADMYGCPVEIPLHAESSTAVGAAVIAGVGVGLFSDFTIAKRVATTERLVLPREDERAVYAERRLHYQQLYERVEELFGRIHD